MKLTEEQIAKRFGCTVEQVRANHKANADALAKMTAKASGKKVNGYTAEQLSKMTAEARMLSVGVAV
jgi:hypothetical protein